MADGVNDSGLARASDEHAAQPPLSAPVAHAGGERRGARPHAARFGAAIALLSGIAVAAVVIALVALAHGGHGSSQQWSDWSPPDSGLQGAREIADHLAPLYRISATEQLAVVTVSSVGGSQAAAATGTSGNSGSSSSGGLQVAVRESPGTSAVSLIGGNTIAYNLCGLGSSNCSIGVGTPSSDRLLLLRREALELALYTLKYISGTQNVLVMLPPGHTAPTAGTLSSKPPTASAKAGQGKQVDLALLFLHDELKPLLDEPLSTTLPLQYPPTVPQIGLWKQTQEAALVSAVTGQGMFTEHVSQAQDGSSLIVLDKLPAQ